MKLTRLWLMSFCCGLLCLSTLVQCSESSGGSGGSGGSSSGVVSSKRAGKDNNTLKKDMTSEQSTIYNIKQLEMKDRLTLVQQQKQKQQQQHKQPHQQQQLRQHSEKVKHNNRTPPQQQQHHVEEQQQQHQQQHKLLMKQQQKLQKEQLQSLGIAPKMASDGSSSKQRSKKLKNSTKNSHGLNKKLLNKLGFTKVKAPNSHNRKRLAVESRRHASPDDSHMFIIKLPPNMNYYSNPKANNGIDNTKNSILQQAAAASKTIAASKHHHHEQNEQKHNGGVATTSATTALEALNNNGKKVSFPFASNGRPGRIYHWNLPVLQKILDEKHRFSNMHKSTKDQLIDIKDVPTWSKPWENDTVEKSYSKANYKKSLKRKSPTYYAPANAVNKNSFNKYFAGNGKPKGFYVIKEDQKKPLYFKNIIS